jgi:hypothetical protein
METHKNETILVTAYLQLSSSFFMYRRQKFSLALIELQKQYRLYTFFHKILLRISFIKYRYLIY